MSNAEETIRKWERYVCLLPCSICSRETGLTLHARIINVCRGGILIESDYPFETGERLEIVASPEIGVDRFQINEPIEGTVRWGKIDSGSLMGLFYIGIEFDELLPLQEAISEIALS